MCYEYLYYNLHLDSFNKTINRYYFQSSEVQMACYFTNWYDLPEQYTRSLIFCIARAQKPLYLTAGKFYVFSLETFGVVSYLLNYKTIQGSLSKFFSYI